MFHFSFIFFFIWFIIALRLHRIVIRIRCDSKNSPILLGAKFGCDPCEEAVHLIQCAQDLGLNLYGFSFHVGTPCLEMDAYCRGIEICKQLIAVAKSIGCSNVKLIDIGGGFLSIRGEELDKVRKNKSNLLLFTQTFLMTLF